MKIRLKLRIISPCLIEDKAKCLLLLHLIIIIQIDNLLEEEDKLVQQMRLKEELKMMNLMIPFSQKM